MKNKLPRKRKKACKKATPEGAYAFMRILNENLMPEGRPARFPKIVPDSILGFTANGYW